MTKVTITIAQKDLATIRLALMGWAERCKGEARTMDELAEDMPAHADRCRANAQASRQFEREARDLLTALPTR